MRGGIGIPIFVSFVVGNSSILVVSLLLSLLSFCPFVIDELLECLGGGLCFLGSSLIFTFVGMFSEDFDFSSSHLVFLADIGSLVELLVKAGVLGSFGSCAFGEASAFLGGSEFFGFSSPHLVFLPETGSLAEVASGSAYSPIRHVFLCLAYHTILVNFSSHFSHLKVGELLDFVSCAFDEASAFFEGFEYSSFFDSGADLLFSKLLANPTFFSVLY